MQHVELHNHTHYSLLDGASTPEQYMVRAKELGLTHMAITDHGTTAGHRDFQRAAKAAGIKPILGMEGYITEDRFDRRTAAKREQGTGIYNHITLLAQNAEGLANIEHMSKIAWSEGYYHKPRIDMDLLGQYSGGVIALSGCMSGMIAKPWLNDNPELADANARKLLEILGDRLFIEVMESNKPELNQYLMSIADKYDIKPVVTSDCHMAREEDLFLAESMLINNTGGKPRKEPDLPRVAKMRILDAIKYLYPAHNARGEEIRMSFTEFELWLHTAEEHVANLAKHDIGPEAVENTMLIADMIGDYPYHEKLDTLPKYAGNVPDEMAELRKRTYAGLKNRGMWQPENIERVDSELATIEELGLPGYFLIECGFIDYAKENDILTGFGRGSAVSYLTNYALGITKINPMPYNLLPERFLSVDRDDPADIDTDFAIDGRYKVKEYAQRTYPYVSNIATIGKYGDKSAIKAAAKIFRAPYTETQKLSNMITSIEEFERHPKTKAYQQRHPHVIPLAKRLDGLIANFGMHAGGIILSKEPIENHVPLQTANDPSDPASDRVPLAALDMVELADMGYIKYDLLGLRTLSIVDDTIRLVRERHGVSIDIEDIPLDDKNLYDMISEGRTAGLFQAEANASTKTILEMGGVSNFLELVASNALVRPGAANSSVGKTYMKGKLTGHVTKMHPAIDDILAETYGAVLYQEQQLLLCEHIAGMSKNDANKVRKAISKKKVKDLEVWEQAFIDGATKTLGVVKAEAVWKDLEASADYAFAKAHAVGYSMLTLLTAYLKYYHPTEFFMSALNRMTGNKTDRMKMVKYLLEAKRLGIRIRLPHINLSGMNIEIQQDEKGDYLRLGLCQVKYIQGKTAEPLIRHRPFNSYAEIERLLKVTGNGFNKRPIESLDAIGGVSFPDHPKTGRERENYFNYLSLPTLDTKDIPPQMLVQFRDLIDYDEDETFVCMGIVGGDKTKPGANWRLIDIIDETAAVSAFAGDEIEVGGVYVFLISRNRVVKYITTEEIVNQTGGDFQKFLEANELPDLPEGKARVIAFTDRTTKAGKKMGNVVFADEYKNMIDALVWPSDFAKAYTLCREGANVEVTFGELEDGSYALQTVKGTR